MVGARLWAMSRESKLRRGLCMGMFGRERAMVTSNDSWSPSLAPAKTRLGTGVPRVVMHGPRPSCRQSDGSLAALLPFLAGTEPVSSKAFIFNTCLQPILSALSAPTRFCSAEAHAAPEESPIPNAYPKPYPKLCHNRRHRYRVP